MRACTAGDEFYLKQWPQVEGYTFKEVLTCFPAATPIGVEEHASQRVVLNPEDSYIVQAGQSISFIPHARKPPAKFTLQEGSAYV